MSNQIRSYFAFWREDPEHKDEHTQALGDNDPIDIVEIGQKIQKRGAIVPAC